MSTTRSSGGRCGDRVVLVDDRDLTDALEGWMVAQQLRHRRLLVAGLDGVGGHAEPIGDSPRVGHRQVDRCRICVDVIRPVEQPRGGEATTHPLTVAAVDDDAGHVHAPERTVSLKPILLGDGAQASAAASPSAPPRSRSYAASSSW
jgi:hypothetical protein